MQKWYKCTPKQILPIISRCTNTLFRRSCAEHDPDTFYWPAVARRPAAAFDNAPNDPNRGDVHYWEVWHGNKPFTEYRKYLFRYVSEFGFQSFPCTEDN